MKVNVYSIKDEKVSFTSLTTNRNDASARRDFAMDVNNPQMRMLNFSPSDFSLYRIGTFDIETGILEPCSPLVQICTGREVLNETE